MQALVQETLFECGVERDHACGIFIGPRRTIKGISLESLSVLIIGAVSPFCGDYASFIVNTDPASGETCLEPIPECPFKCHKEGDKVTLGRFSDTVYAYVPCKEGLVLHTFDIRARKWGTQEMGETAKALARQTAAVSDLQSTAQ
ncbi:hypothetical protein KIPB_008556 [Kipferlia bialata]|uniref:Uncharacterized protein n=1 Tax=Kipferlia bialata TaxID=797122 RepID=A0A9K3D2K4_9EUKA|nr:hypothetical protein KIPB_008556 [Kipferlia bialata]|eukprot:g8556.t1